jgi:glycosyltransferase involved in cell wall biosynthesis
MLIAHDVLSRRDPRARRLPGAAAHVHLGDMRARRHEREALRRAEVVVVTGDEDAAAVRALGAGRVEVVPNGADDALAALPLDGPVDRLLFVGWAGHEPNADAVAWWSREVVPAAPDLPPLCVAGRGWDHAPRRPGVEYLGYVDELSGLLTTSIVVAPLRVGGGTKLKVAEAMLAGRPIAATPIAVEGLPVRDGIEALVAATPEGLAAAIRRLLGDAELRRSLGERARAAAVGLAWSHVAERMDAVYRGILP